TSNGASCIVQVSVSHLINSSNKKSFDCNLIFKETPDSHPINLNNVTNIAQYTKTDDSTETNNITLPWTNQNGILLSLDNNVSPAGQYNGVISWTLLDSIANQ